ncbi:ABC transporter ATP-binding protein [Nocardiopsis tropica]|uniref:ABC transporter ATP-binding protein n=1 Tax=Nocardiopsis tropica TaxID=109330 RepID=A0ABU7KYW0_9ACTN|nr:ABC transporter ATP-binding protein [Nocardiopsis umidischolae]MEE2054459.1 ABC transporter ATP-binding protein [Nocardiopsis umidischolae]
MVDTFTPPSPGNTATPVRLLLWLVLSQKSRIAMGATLGSLWMLGLTVPPYVLSRAIDDGLSAGDTGALSLWVAVLFGVGVLNAALGIARHRTMTKIRMDASFRTVRATVRHSTRLGATLPRRVSSGEVASIGIGDVQVIAQSLTVTGPGFGAVVAYIVIAALLLSISPLLAVVVLAGVPMLAITVGPLLHRLLGIGSAYREMQGALTARLVDVVTGLRVLNGLGGKDSFARHFHRESRELRDKGYRIGGVTSWVGALGVGLPALFLAVVTWLAARMAASGAISIGDLVAVYGYVAVLVVPVAFFIEGGTDITRALVCARRVIRFLNLEPEHADDGAAGRPPAPGAELYDPASGVRVGPGVLTALAGARPADAEEVLDRLGRFTASDAEWGGVPLREAPLDAVRERILLADNDADFFSGSIRDVVAGAGEPDDEAVRAVLHTAVATDIVDAMADGLDSVVNARGHNLSGGQLQRLRLARALYTEPEVLLAVEPTSAVDSLTEAAMAARLRQARAGTTTVVSTTSPLVLDQADAVVYLVDGRAAATGTHHGLLRTEPGYRALVSRDAEWEPLR